MQGHGTRGRVGRQGVASIAPGGHRRRPPAVAVLVLAIAVLLGGCTLGGSSGDDPDAATADTPDASDDTAADVDEEAQVLGEQLDVDDASFEVPDVTGLPYPEARAELMDLGAVVSREVVPSSEDQQLVVDQYPEPGAEADPGDRVVLDVSDGTGGDDAGDDTDGSDEDGSGDDGSDAGGSGDSGDDASELPSTSASPPRAPARTAIADLPSGLFCRDLHARGYTYPEAVWYWDRTGRPSRMDASNNGIPCQTVYPASAVDSYWQVRTPVFELPSGLFCRDVHARGYSYDEAVWYWFREGMPSRMDASDNGIPCQTVYPASAVDSYWGL
jgi:hypothetical protein